MRKSQLRLNSFLYFTEDSSAKTKIQSQFHLTSKFCATTWGCQRLATCVGVTGEFWAGFLELPFYLLLSNCPQFPNIPLNFYIFYSSSRMLFPPESAWKAPTHLSRPSSNAVSSMVPPLMVFSLNLYMHPCSISIVLPLSPAPPHHTHTHSLSS